MNQTFTHDNHGTPVILEAYSSTMFAPHFINDLASLWPIARPTYLKQEIDFLKKFPEVVPTEPYFAAFKPLFTQGTEVINWSEVSTLMEATLKNHFVVDPDAVPEAVKNNFKEYSLVMVTIRDEGAEAPSGFIVFMTSPTYPAGKVKATMFAVEPQSAGRNLRQLLMSSIFAIKPEIDHIFLDTRITNETMINECTEWGFKQDHNPSQEVYFNFNLKHWIFMEYRTEESDQLQKIAATFE